MTTTAHSHYTAALELRSRILAGQSNERPVQAWAAVCRQCAIASRKFRDEINDITYTRADLSFLNNLDRVWWYAKAQVETLAREAA